MSVVEWAVWVVWGRSPTASSCRCVWVWRKHHASRPPAACSNQTYVRNITALKFRTWQAKNAYVLIIYIIRGIFNRRILSLSKDRLVFWKKQVKFSMVMGNLLMHACCLKHLRTGTASSTSSSTSSSASTPLLLALRQSYRTESHFRFPSTSHIYLSLKLQSHFTSQLYNAYSNYTFHGDKHHTLCYTRNKKYIIRFTNDQLIPSNLKAYSNYTCHGDKHRILRYSRYKTDTFFASWMINSFHLIFEILLSFTAAQNTHSKNTTQRYENKTQFSTKSNSDLRERRGDSQHLDLEMELDTNSRTQTSRWLAQIRYETQHKVNIFFNR